ncbi:hypothetical protein [Streptomyces sp. NPDC056464]|uniref:hypothetical protein n=1 Tax=Streptomyces sp. NPDC056464 TaxID=3345828 RepID=UPI00369B17E4
MNATTRPDTAEPAAVPGRYFLRFPGSWWNLDLDPSTRDAAIRRRLLEGLEPSRPGQPLDRETAELADALVRSARKAARQAHARGALQLAGIFELFDGAPLIASTMVFRVSPPKDTEAALCDLLVAYAVRNAGLPHGRGTRANGAEFIELPLAGPAGRVTSVEDVDFYGRGWVRMAIMQTVVPIPGTRDFLVVASTTPNLTLRDEFFTVFDAIAETLFFTGGE